MTFIYTLSDNSGVRYIGKSDVPFERLKDHLKECKKKRTHKEKWIHSLIERNELPILEILDEVSKTEWSFYEKYWISQFRSWGFSIVNGTIGGEGSDGFKGKKHTKETKKKCRLGAINRKTKTRMIGETNGSSKLTSIQVDEIKIKAKDNTHAKLAKEYSVSKTTITFIVNGKRWNKIAGDA